MEPSDDGSHDPNKQLVEAMDAVVDGLPSLPNISFIDQLLQHPDLDLNYDIGGGETPLFKALFHPDKHIFLRLLNKGYNIDHRNDLGQSLLHVAVWCSPVDYVHGLIKRGTNIIVIDGGCCRPQIYVARDGNLEVVCKLLYYGADANVKCSESMTPLMWAYWCAKDKIVEVLLRHTDLDLSGRDKYGRTTLYHAVEGDLDVRGLLNIVDLKNEHLEELIDLALQHHSSEVFELLWNLFGDRVVIKPSFFDKLLTPCFDSGEELLEAWNLLINSPHMKKMYELNSINELNEGFNYWMLHCLNERDIDPDTRLDVITFFVGLGMRITQDNLNFVHRTFLHKDELRFLIYTYDYEEEVKQNELDLELRTLFTLEIEKDIVYDHILTRPTTIELRDSLGYFALPQKYRSLIQQCVTQDNNNIDPYDGRDNYWADLDCIERLKQIPEVPSLVEVCRNEFMRGVKRTYNITKAYQYLELVEKCHLPPVIKDILLLKIKLY